MPSTLFNMKSAVMLLWWLAAPGGWAQWLTVTHIWSSVDFEYPSSYMRSLFIKNKEHVPEDVVMLDVDMYKGRIFVTTPSLIGGTPASLSTLVMKPDKHGFPLLKPFPDWLWHNVTDPTDCHSIKSIFRIKIDKLGRLWAVDSGVGFAFNNRKDKYNCNPKILVFDLNNHDKLIRSYEINKLELDEDSLLLNIEVQIMSKDGKETYAYIADSMDDLASAMPVIVIEFVIQSNDLKKVKETVGTRMIVYNFAKDELHVYQHPYFFPDPAFGFFHVNGQDFTVMDGLFTIALDEKSDTLYFHTLSSGRECSAPASLLRNKTMTEAQSRLFTRSPERPFHVSNEVITDNGLLIFPSLEHNSLYAWDTKTPYTQENFMLIAKDEEALQFPTGMKIANNKFIMMTTRLQNMLVTGVPNRGEINYRILMGDIDHLKSAFSRHSLKPAAKHKPIHQHSGKHHVHLPTSYSYSRNNLYRRFPVKRYA